MTCPLQVLPLLGPWQRNVQTFGPGSHPMQAALLEMESFVPIQIFGTGLESPEIKSFVLKCVSCMALGLKLETVCIVLIHVAWCEYTAVWY